MARTQFQTLTEPMYYVLLSLCAECCGVDIMRRVEEISQGRVRVGAGTLYMMLAKFEEAGAIEETHSEGRKRWYLITPAGKQLLRDEYTRIKTLHADGEKIMEGLL